ncbi:MAG TPA: acyl carrier protein [Chromatiales bacterium]|nr:acyl carrier protein [Thiotrichales bacterium]HIP69491.1 acyl carrier protein [Chromatiales bacterium]
MSEKSALELEIGQMIVDALNLEDIVAEDIDPESPLFRDGLGLDSIDALELSMAVSQQYGFQLRSNDKQIFASLRSLSEHIAQHKTT